MSGTAESMVTRWLRLAACCSLSGHQCSLRQSSQPGDPTDDRLCAAHEYKFQSPAECHQLGHRGISRWVWHQSVLHSVIAVPGIWPTGWAAMPAQKSALMSDKSCLSQVVSSKKPVIRWVASSHHYSLEGHKSTNDVTSEPFGIGRHYCFRVIVHSTDDCSNFHLPRVILDRIHPACTETADVQVILVCPPILRLPPGNTDDLWITV